MNSNYVNETPTDYHLAKIYFVLLVGVAQKNQRITYGELVALAKETHPNDAVVQNAIAVSTGRRLEIIQRYVAEQNLPDITSLVFNKNTDECGEGIGHDQPEILRQQVYAFDWETVSADFEQQMQQRLEHVALQTHQVKNPKTKKTAQPKVSLEDALKAMSGYYMANKDHLPKDIRLHREKLLELIMSGVSPEDAFGACS